MSDRIGLDLLVDSLRSEVAGLPAALAGGNEQAQFDAIAIARQNKVLGLVQKRLARGPFAPYSLAEAAATMAQNATLLAALKELAPAMHGSGRPFVVIKGPLQQRILYGTFFQRPSADLDVLVQPPDFGRFRDLLIAAGYGLATPSMWWRGTLGEEHFFKRGPPGIAVDLHHHVHQPGASAPPDFGRFFGRSEDIDVGGVKIPTLNARDGTLLCTISIAKALFNREPSGAYMCDLYAGLIAATPRAIDSFVAAARDAGLMGHAQVALRLMSAVFGVEVGYGDALAGVSGDDLLRMVFLPRDPATRWPKRRAMLWELCGRQPARYARELGRVAGSELMRRAFERPGPAQREPSA